MEEGAGVPEGEEGKLCPCCDVGPLGELSGTMIIPKIL